MEIRKGIVKDQGYDDVNCTFGITADGRKYYFIENGEVKDNKVIASTVLKEAIRHAKDTSLGVIDLDGNTIIPFENRAIKPIEDNYLLAERSVPKDQNVISSLAVKNDPSSATRLVRTASSIRQKMNNKMGANARFLFYDQCAEAAIYDLEGNNITNGDYFSYIGTNNKNFYFCKNVLDSEVNTYSINDKEEKQEVEEEQKEVAINKELVEGKLDVLSNSIDSDTIAASINDEMKKQETYQKEKTEEQEQKTENNQVTLDKSIFGEQNVMPKEENKEVVEESQQEVINKDAKEEPQEVANQEVSEKQQEVNAKEVAEKQQDVIAKEVAEEHQENKIVDISSKTLKNDIEKTVSESNQNEIPLPTATIPDKLNFSTYEKSFMQPAEYSTSEFSKIADETDYHNRSLEEEFVVKDTIIEEVRDTMKDLISQNKEQQDTIDSQEKSIRNLEEENKEARAKNSDQTRKISILETRTKNYEAMISKLEAKNQMLESKNHMQEKTIAKQEDELNILRPQVEGKKDLVALLADAKNILGNDNIINYDFETYKKSKVA